jgi:phosphohistidine swiveling domain-containing protein
LEIYEKGYVWFEAAWWIWDMDNQQLAREYITEHFRCLRENTQDFVPASENIINNSLRAIYPELGDLAGVLRIDEVKSNKIPTTQELEMRQKGYFFVDNHIYTNNSRKFIEDKYNLMLQTFDEKSVDSITGVVAYGGSNVLIGKVSVVKNIKDFEKVRSGDILVSPMTLPNFLPIIKLSSAIITDEGGALCHAAIVSREMKKPCIIGTKIATKVLKDGDLVEVDANHGVVKILKRA